MSDQGPPAGGYAWQTVPPAWSPPPPGVPAWGPDGEPLPGQLVPLAGWWQRLAADLVDGFIVSAVMFVFMPPAFVLMGVLVEVAEPLIVLPMVLVFGVSVGLQVLLLLMDAAPYGQTPGRYVLGIRVVTADGRLLSRGQAVLRGFAEVLSAWPLMLGYLWPLWDRERRTFHDMAVGTRVVVAGRPAPSLVDVVKAPFGTAR